MILHAWMRADRFRFFNLLMRQEPEIQLDRGGLVAAMPRLLMRPRLNTLREKLKQPRKTDRAISRKARPPTCRLAPAIPAGPATEIFNIRAGMTAALKKICVISPFKIVIIYLHLQRHAEETI